MDKNYLVVYCTCPERATAESIATVLVSERLAACVNVLPAITSFYRWEGKAEQDNELLLMIKTRNDGYAALEARILELHPYEVPEIIAVPVSRGVAGYLTWIDASVGGAS